MYEEGNFVSAGYEHCAHGPSTVQLGDFLNIVCGSNIEGRFLAISMTSAKMTLCEVGVMVADSKKHIFQMIFYV